MGLKEWTQVLESGISTLALPMSLDKLFISSDSQISQLKIRSNNAQFSVLLGDKWDERNVPSVVVGIQMIYFIIIAVLNRGKIAM